MTKLKRALLDGNLTIGSWITLAHPGIAEIMAEAGFDWLTIDLEHTSITIRETEDLIRVIALSGVAPLVRLSSNDPVQIKRVMDSGAHGVIVPMVTHAEHARAAVAAVRYPPAGARGVGLGRAQGYGPGFDAYKKWVRDESVVIAMVEHLDAVRNLEGILAVEGVDAIIVGPYDLSASLGVPGDFEHPAFVDALHTIRAAAARSRVTLGYHVVPPRPELVKSKIAEGYRFIAYSLDTHFLGQGARDGLETIRKFPAG